MSLRRLALALCAALVGIGLLAVSVWRLGSARHPVFSSPTATPASASETVLQVPETTSGIVLDGELSETEWQRAAGRTGAFVTQVNAVAPVAARPYSEARFAQNSMVLYIALYASDEDIEEAQGASGDGQDAGVRDDAFHLQLSDFSDRKLEIEVRPSCKTAVRGAGEGGIRADLQAACEVDGTANDPNDDDEEWSVELAIRKSDLVAYGFNLRAPIRLDAHRCDRPKEAKQPLCGYAQVTLQLK
jgi:hypothetical protein